MTKVAKPTPGDLEALARQRLDDAEALLAAERYEGASYLSGYAMEMTLKARICRAHQWNEYPPKMSDRLEQALKTHNLDDLLLLSGDATTIVLKHAVDWVLVNEWNPEQRYTPVAVTAQEAQDRVGAVDALMVVL